MEKHFATNTKTISDVSITQEKEFLIKFQRIINSEKFLILSKIVRLFSF
jgi:hypothetical protein